ncbi:uncharacterized protein LOC119582822 [Penaeus monodon]|uniref:uncharacterized protein LOC119582822 n=1 Tax=Penaeus monodon TaxID=6687 RepID=UPI0018A6EC35|nr:uncharacterized protein LOC119582822 [Penaeus monodon]
MSVEPVMTPSQSSVGRKFDMCIHIHRLVLSDGETGDEDDSDEDDSRPFSLFEVTDYGRVCQDLSLALQSDVANRNLHELAKIHDLYRTLARQSPRVHTGGPKLQAATLAEILANSRDSLLEDQKPPLEDDSICSEPVQAKGKIGPT